MIHKDKKVMAQVYQTSDTCQLLAPQHSLNDSINCMVCSGVSEKR